MNKITRITMEGNTATIHKTEQVQIYRRISTHPNKKFKEYLKDNNVTDIAAGWAGFGYVRKTNGLWYKIDIINKIIQNDPIETKTELPNSFIQSHCVSEQDWGKWATEIPIRRTRTLA